MSTSGSKIGQARLGDRELKLTIDRCLFGLCGFSRGAKFPHCLTPFLEAANRAGKTEA